jgi:hypothetical protein
MASHAEGEYHHLTKQELLELVQDEWTREFNGFFIGRDIDCVGRLCVFFHRDRAFAGYEDFDNKLFLASCDAEACNGRNWDELVRLTPDDAEEYSFRRCSIISKKQAWTILQEYVNSRRLIELYLENKEGKPMVAPSPEGRHGAI